MATPETDHTHSEQTNKVVALDLTIPPPPMRVAGAPRRVLGKGRHLYNKSRRDATPVPEAHATRYVYAVSCPILRLTQSVCLVGKLAPRKQRLRLLQNLVTINDRNLLIVGQECMHLPLPLPPASRPRFLQPPEMPHFCHRLLP